VSFSTLNPPPPPSPPSPRLAAAVAAWLLAALAMIPRGACVAPPPVMRSLEVGYDRPGRDMAVLPALGSAGACGRACVAAAGCVAWSFYSAVPQALTPPGCTAGQPCCLLKNGVPAPVLSRAPGATSGVVDRASADQLVCWGADEQAVSSLTASVDASRATAEALKSDVESVSQRHVAAVTDQGRLEAERQNAARTLASLAARREAVTASIADLQRQAEAARRQAAVSDAAMQRVSKQVAEATGVREIETARQARTQNAVAELAQAAQRARDEGDRLAASRRELEGKQRDLDDEIRTATAAMQRAEATARQTLQGVVDGKLAAARAKEAEVDPMTARDVADVEEALAREKLAQAQLRGQTTLLAAQQAAAQRRQDQATALRKDAAALVSSLRANITAAERLLVASGTTLLGRKAAMTALQGKVAALQAGARSTATVFDSLNARIAALTVRWRVGGGGGGRCIGRVRRRHRRSRRVLLRGPARRPGRGRPPHAAAHVW
jgi:hypothetical protein